MTDEDVFIDESAVLQRGSEATKALSKCNDLGYIKPKRGIDTIPIERWRLAQHYERTTWMHKAKGALTDRNEDHMANFHNYDLLRDLQFDNAIELGCGPFTNLRLISQKCRIIRCSLLDPLLKDYLYHPHCMYDDKFLYKRRCPILWKHFRIPKTWRHIGRIPIDHCFSIPIEELDTNLTYDLVVLINVLEHCYDIARIFSTIRNILKPGGLLIFHDKYYESDKLPIMLKHRFDAGHPLRLAREPLDNFLNLFEMLYKNIINIPNPPHGEYGAKEAVYFIGQF